MESLTIRGSMGGFEAGRLGNASPRVLEVKCRMGGADIDLRGAWMRDADISIDVAMGGIGVQVPDDVRIEGLEDPAPTLGSAAEVSLPVLRFKSKSKMGEIEFY